MDKYNWIVGRGFSFSFLISLSLFVFTICVPLNNFQFILALAVPLFLFIFLFFRWAPILSNKTDILLIGFVLYSGLSTLWAANISVVWFYLFGWLGMISWYFLFKKINQTPVTTEIIGYVLSVLFLTVLLHHLVAILFEININTSWNAFFGKNRNYTSSLLVGLFPFFFFCVPTHGRLVAFIKVLSFVSVLFVLFYTKAIGATVSLGVIIVVYVLLVNRPIKSDIFWMVFLVTIVLGTSLIFYLSNRFDFSTPEFRGFMTRAHTISNSLELSKESPLLGWGFGNSHIVLHSIDISDLWPLNGPNLPMNYKVHNLMFELLVDLGFGGLALIVLPFFFTLKYAFTKYQYLSPLECSSLFLIICFVVQAMFYNSIYLRPNHFSSLHLLTFSCLGILTCRIKDFSMKVSGGAIAIICFLLFGIFAFIYYRQKNIELHKVYNSDLDVSYSVLNQIEANYCKMFYTIDPSGDPIAGHIAEGYLLLSECVKAEKYYLNALEDAPYHDYTILQYANFLHLYKYDYNAALFYAKKVYSRHRNSFEANILLAEIYIELDQFESAKKHMSTFAGRTSPKLKTLIETQYNDRIVKIHHALKLNL